MTRRFVAVGLVMLAISSLVAGPWYQAQARRSKAARQRTAHRRIVKRSMAKRNPTKPRVTGAVSAQPTPTPSPHIETVRQVIDELFNRGDFSNFDRAIAPGYFDHAPFPGQPQSRAGFRRGIREFRRAFPDLHMQIDDIFAAGDKVVFRTTMSGTQNGPFLGIAPTGKKFRVTAIDIVRFSEGRAIEHWGTGDNLGMMQQLGYRIIPPSNK